MSSIVLCEGDAGYAAVGGYGEWEWWVWSKVKQVDWFTSVVKRRPILLATFITLKLRQLEGKENGK